MNERVGELFRAQVLIILLCGALAIAGGLLLIMRGDVLDGILIAAAAALLTQWYWRSTERKRSLISRGFHTGHRDGMHWLYEELQGGVIVSLPLTLDYAGRGEYEIHVPGERAWKATMPGWARERRAEIVERLKTVFKRSQIHFDADSAPADG